MKPTLPALPLASWRPTKERLQPRASKWNPEGGMALLPYEDVRRSADPARSLLRFCESVYRAARTRAHWSAAEPRAVAEGEVAG